MSVEELRARIARWGRCSYEVGGSKDRRTAQYDMTLNGLLASLPGVLPMQSRRAAESDSLRLETEEMSRIVRLKATAHSISSSW